VLFNPGGADPGSIERTILAVRASGASVPPALLGALQHAFGGDGSVSEQVNLTSFGLLALRAAGAPAPPGAVPWLLRQRNSDGGFSFATAGGASDVDDTGAALEALADAGGAAASARARAVGFIRSQQNGDGGFPAQGTGDSNAQSTAWAVQGLIAAGVDPASVRRAGGGDPLGYLDSLIAPDGHVRYSRAVDQTPVWVTAEAAMALARKPLPLVPSTPGSGSSAAPAAPSPHAHRTHPGGQAAGPPANRARPSHAAASARALAALSQLVADAGVATAVALAPVGAG
jgi:energy-coupling factor transport system substrate-specific component